MPLSRRLLLRSTLSLGVGAAAYAAGITSPGWASEEHPTTGPTPAEALAWLKAGNSAFTKGRPAAYAFDRKRRHELAGGQHPFATVVCCSDSRVGPEQIFEAGLGQLFVIRNAGSTVANPQAMGSVEYSVEHLGVPLVLVLGHSNCGAVKAAAEVVEKHIALPGSLGEMVAPIVPAVEFVQPRGGDLINAAVHENVVEIVHALRSPRQPILAQFQRKGALRVVGGVYDLETGVVEFIEA
ncbi:carbonic anhydrase [Sphingomonas hengshuiensis]|nr:carbonic anhydrase [Sphingomonas hengshuiensis]